jgi:uncharacterized membrane protein
MNINRTITKWGGAKLKEQLTNFIDSRDTLLMRNKILKAICYHEHNRTVIKNCLTKIKSYEEDIWWLFNDSMNVNNSLRDNIKIYSPYVFAIICILMFMVLRWNNNLLTFRSYLSSYISSFLEMLMSDKNMISFLTNILATLFIIYQLYCMYESFESSYKLSKNNTAIKDKLANIDDCLRCIKKIYKYDIFTEKEHVKNDLAIEGTRKFEKEFNNLLQYIGTLDALISTAELTLYDNFVLPIYSSGKVPHIQIINLWNSADFCMEDTVLTVVVGKDNNKYLSVLLSNVILAQTIGVAQCEYMNITPFGQIVTDIKDLANKEGFKLSIVDNKVNNFYDIYKLINEKNNLVVVSADADSEIAKLSSAVVVNI